MSTSTPHLHSGNSRLDAVYDLACDEARLNSHATLNDSNYNHGESIPLEAFHTGELWPWVWTRDIAYSLDLGLAQLDPPRAGNSLLFKLSALKTSFGPGEKQIVQDTGSGGSYPVSTDRAVWALGARSLMQSVSPPERSALRAKIHPYLRGTIEQDRHLIFDPLTGLYRGEQSFLDWREQSYPPWTRDHVLPIAMSFSLSTNACMLILLRVTAENARHLGRHDEAARYHQQSMDLLAAMRTHFMDPTCDRLRSLLFSEFGESPRPLDRQELLGISLCILEGVVDPLQARQLLSHYPMGPHGPPVCWPLERTVDIYHNQGIWPFVTAYALRAARNCGHTPMVSTCFRSLFTLCERHGSNMENADFRSGDLFTVDGPRSGPVINSRRQLWSVAASICMIHEGLFGLESTDDTLHFRPRLDASFCWEFFPESQPITLHDFNLRGRRHHCTLQLPSLLPESGILCVKRVRLNGRPIDPEPVSDDHFLPENHWEIELQPAPDEKKPSLNLVDVTLDAALYAPETPEGPDTVRSPDFNLESHPGPSTLPNFRRIAAKRNADATRISDPFRVSQGGLHRIQISYANTHGPISTGITCAVKHLALMDEADTLLAHTRVVMPHTKPDGSFDLSSAFFVQLSAQKTYRLRLCEDAYCLNMSALESNRLYTGGNGGGPDPFNQILFDAFCICPHSPESSP